MVDETATNSNELVAIYRYDYDASNRITSIDDINGTAVSSTNNAYKLSRTNRTRVVALALLDWMASFG